MVYKLGSLADMDALPILHFDTWSIIHAYVRDLSENYGAERDVDNADGGYILYAEPGTSLAEIKKIFDYPKYTVEYVTLHRHTNPLFCSAHYVLNNEYTVIIVMAVEDIPAKWLDELEGEPII